MANHRAITAVGQAVLCLLEDAGQRYEDTSRLAFNLYKAADFKDPPGEGFALYLYRVVPSTARRHLPPRQTPKGLRLRPALLIDLCYILTVWASDARVQQRRLGWALSVLDETPIMPASLLNSVGPEDNIFHVDERVEVVADILSAQDYLQICDPLKPTVPLGAAYIVRMLALDSAATLEEHPLVQTRTFKAGRLVER